MNFSYCINPYLDHLGDLSENYAKYQNLVLRGKADKDQYKNPEDYFTKVYLKGNDKIEDLGLVNDQYRPIGVPDCETNIIPGSPIAKAFLDLGIISKSLYNIEDFYKEKAFHIEIKPSNLQWNHEQHNNSIHLDAVLVNYYHPDYSLYDKNQRRIPVLYNVNIGDTEILPQGISQNEEITFIQKSIVDYLVVLAQAGEIKDWNHAKILFEEISLLKISDIPISENCGLKIRNIEQRFRWAVRDVYKNNDYISTSIINSEHIQDSEKNNLSVLDPSIHDSPEKQRGRINGVGCPISDINGLNELFKKQHEINSQLADVLRNEFTKEEQDVILARLIKRHGFSQLVFKIGRSFSPPEKIRAYMDRTLGLILGEREKEDRQNTRNKNNQTKPLFNAEELEDE